jgi:hypothetical protein
MVIHMTALLVVASISLHVARSVQTSVVVETPPAPPPLDDTLDKNPSDLRRPPIDFSAPASPAELESSLSTSPEIGGPPSLVPLNPWANDPNAGPLHVDLSPFGDRKAPPADLLKTVGVPGGTASGFGSRFSQAKSDALKRGDATVPSELAAAEALKWLSIHQLPDGGWDFDLAECPTCKGKCSDSGIAGPARIAATSLALLPFLGAGETHTQGQYKEAVHNGLYFLMGRAKREDEHIISLFEPEGTMYSHGLATIVLCEAYAMSQDKSLLPYAQGAVNFIEHAQDPDGGGWRYRERMPGDTSVTGWQLMALKSAQLAGLETRSSTIPLVNKFLDSVEDLDGAAYGYRTPNSARTSMTSVGLLCRMYLGWGKDKPALQHGVKLLSQQGPSISDNADMYYNYYATQIMRHWGGEEWERWNYRIREWLIAKQARKGHEKGSWFMNDSQYAPKAAAGGRLYCTSMAAMILEVYYRTLPLYSEQAVKDEFAF